MNTKALLCIVLGSLLYAAPPNVHADEQVNPGKYSTHLAQTQKELRRLIEELDQVQIPFKRKMLIYQNLENAADALQYAQRDLTPGH